MGFFSGFSGFGTLKSRFREKITDKGARYRHMSRSVENPGTIAKDGGIWILNLSDQARKYAKEVPFHDCIVLNDSKADITVEINQNGEKKRVPSSASLSIEGSTIYSLQVVNKDAAIVGNDIAANELQLNFGKDVS